MTRPTASSPAPDAGPPPPIPAEPRQRWRLTFARDPVPADAVGRVAIEAWADALGASGLPVAGLEVGGTGRARIAFGAPLPAAARGEAELADLWLLERRTAWEVRSALAERLPPAHRWIAAEDVWLGAPALAGRVVAADWRVALDGIDGGDERDAPAADDLARLADAARALLAAPSVPRVRLKGGAEKRYDLRPLLADLVVLPPAHGGPMSLGIRTRFDPESGSGRPEEVVAALGEAAGLPLVVASLTRERLILADEPDVARRR